MAAAAAVGALAQSAPTILLGEPVEVRPGETATLTIQAVGGPDEKVQLFATAESPPEWLAQGAWSAGPTAAPRLAIEISPPAGAVPGVREFAVHATGSGGFTTQAVVVWRVLAPRCQGALEYDADGACRQCPPNHVPNAAKTGCDACPPNTERGDGATQCVDCPSGQTSGAGASCGCGTAARLTDAGCVACPVHADSRRNALNCDACPPGQHRPPDAAFCAPCPAAGCAAKPAPRGWTAAQAKPKITITASETELVESEKAHDVTVTVTYSPAAPAGTALQLAFACTSTAAWAEGGGCACPSCPRDYGAGGFGSVQADGLTTVTLEGWVDVRRDDIDDDGEVLEIAVRNADGFDVAAAKITLREPDRPTILVGDPAAGDLRPSARCGGERLCLSERAGAVEVPIRIEHPPTDHTYRDCGLSVYQHRLNTATPISGGTFNDYQLVGAERLGPAQNWRATVSVVLHDDGEVEGLEALTVRGKCDGSSDPLGKRHFRLGFQPKTFWIEDVRWPVLSVARPSGGHVSGPGIDCGSGTHADCEEAHASRATLELTATADEHHRFVRWGGACSGAEPTCTVTLDADTKASAEFAAASHVLTVKRPENGRVGGSGIDCGSGTRADCEERYKAEATIALRATADANHRFVGWSGSCSGAAATCSVHMDAAKGVGAAFAVEQRRLLVSPPDGGRITGDGIDCGGAGADCSESYDHGTELELTATADAGREFASWSDNCASGASSPNVCTVTMDGMEVVGATFAIVRPTLTVTRPINGYVTAKGIDCGSGSRAACTTTKDHGTTLVVRATADEGYEFESWAGCDSEWPKCQLTLEADLTVGATFAVAKRTLTVTRPTNGHVTAPGIDCGAGARDDCTERYTLGTSVKVTATAATGHDFERWGGDCSGTPETCVLEMAEDRTATATFKPEKRTLSVTVASKGTVAGTGDFTCSSGTCTQEYDYGTSVTLTATEATGHDFENWAGGCSGTTTTCTLEMTKARAATATFKPEKRTLSVTVAGTGTVTGTGDFSCSSGTCTQEYDYGTSVALTATEATGHDFEKWGGACTGTTTTCTLEMTENRTATATFKPEKRTLTVTRPDDGWVTGTGISCGAGSRDDCTESYDYGTSVTLRVRDNSGYDFERWSGDCSGSSRTCDLEMTENRSVGVTFDRQTRRLSVTIDGEGEVTGTGNFSCSSGTCTKDYDYGTRVTLRATADTGHDFEKWSGSCRGTRTTCTLDMTRNRSTTAKFKPETRRLSVTIDGEGEVTGTGGFSCSSGTCTKDYDYGTRVTLTATADTGHDFEKWSGACRGTSTTCTLDMTANRSTTAKFKPQKRRLSVSVVGSGTVTVKVGETESFECTSANTPCAQDYDYDTDVTLTATPDTNHVFEKWTGDCDGTSKTCTLSMTENRSVTAKFKPRTWRLSVKIKGEGRVTGTGGFSCRSGTCTKYYDHGTVVTLTPTADTGHDFEKWSGDCTGAVCAPEMTQNRSVTAHFKPEKRTLSVAVAGTGTVTGTGGFTCSSGTCTQEYDYGTSVTLTATEATGHDFEEWSGSCSGTSETCTRYMTQHRSTTAHFKPEKRQLSVTIDGEGRVTGTGGFSCASGTCTKNYDYGTEVTLTASPSLSHVSTWSGCDETAGRTCDVTMDGGKSVTVTYTMSCPSGCTLDKCGTTEVCNCPGSSCPSNYARHGNCLEHARRSCTGQTDGCGKSVYDTKCTVVARTVLRNRAVDTCWYEHRDRDIFGCHHDQLVCRPDITRVGCVYSPGTFDPGPGPIGLEDEEDPDYKHGYIVPTFECGAKANTCDVEFEDETVTTDDYGVVDKDDTDDEWKWECHSDNGTVRECSASKDGG